MKDEEIVKMLVKIDTRLDVMGSNFTKIVLALIGVIAANIGVKIVGSPPLLDILFFIVILSSVVVIGHTFITRGKLHNGMIATRLFFVGFMLYSSIVKTYVFAPGMERSPRWFSPSIDVFLIILAMLLLAMTWRDWDVRVFNKNKWNIKEQWKKMTTKK